MDNQEIELRQDSAMLLRTDMRSKKSNLNEANAKYREISSNVAILDEELTHATVRVSELQSGKGKSLASASEIEVFEFWLSIPGYQGSIQSAKAEVTLHGSLQHVSNVSSTSKSGLGGGIVGGLVFGPLGAAAGVLATRKSKVSTHVQKIDTRQVELQITGPGYAWSVLAHSGYAETFRKLRDLINAYGSSVKNIQDSLREQIKKVDSLKEKLTRLKAGLHVAAKEAEERKLAYDTTRKDFISTRLPLLMDLKFRWECLSIFWQWVAIFCGPVVLVILAGVTVYARIMAQPWLNEGICLASGNVLFWGVLFIVYLIRYRV
jgi:gas vesicle protein